MTSPLVNAGPVATVPMAALRKHERFPSKFLEGERDIIVFTPPGYMADPERRYPVLYLQDGQNLFDPATAYVPGNDWRVKQTAQRLILEGLVEPLVIVGIYNTGVRRIAEYTPTVDSRVRNGGKADLYGRLIVEELHRRGGPV